LCPPSPVVLCIPPPFWAANRERGRIDLPRQNLQERGLDSAIRPFPSSGFPPLTVHGTFSNRTRGPNRLVMFVDREIPPPILSPVPFICVLGPCPEPIVYDGSVKRAGRNPPFPFPVLFPPMAQPNVNNAEPARERHFSSLLPHLHRRLPPPAELGSARAPCSWRVPDEIEIPLFPLPSTPPACFRKPGGHVGDGCFNSHSVLTV